MPDITVCSNTKCKKADTCYRVQAKADPWRQSFSAFPSDTKKKPCERYIKCTAIAATAIMHKTNNK